jgi:hypothetical protein
MSTGKGGEVSIVPALLFGAAGVAATLAVGGVVLAVNAYISQRERIKRELELAQNEQNVKLSRDFDEWQRNIISTYTKPDDPAPTIRSVGERLADTVSRKPISTALKDGELLASLREEEQSVEIPEKVEIAVVKPLFELQDLIANVQELILKVDFKLTDNIMNNLNRLYHENELQKAALIAREIRLAVSEERNRIEEMKQKEKMDAQSILDGLPPDYPSEARNVLTEAAEGRGRFDQTTKKSIQEMIQRINTLAAAEALNRTFTEMGYDIGPIGNSLFSEGGEVYFRKGEWEDGYGVKLKCDGDKIKFFMQRTAETGSEYDKDMENEWRAQFPQVKEKLANSGLELRIEEIQNCKIQSVNKISVDTKKKKVKDASVKTKPTAAAKAAEMEKSI